MNSGKILITIIALVILSITQSCETNQVNSKENRHIYLLIGQSNMAGRSPFTDADSGTIERCFLLNDSDEWEAARNPLNRYSTIRKSLDMQKMGPGYTFALEMLNREKDISIGLVVNAKGGTSINLWGKDTKFYQEAVRRTKIAQKKGILKGILWHQGEADREDSVYIEKMAKLISDFRDEFNESNLPFVAGQIYNVKLINDQIASLPKLVPFTGFASSEELTVMDRWHFDAESMKELGRRYADEMTKINNKLPEK